MVRLLAIFTAVCVLTGGTTALTLSGYENVVGGVHDAWNQANPENVRGGGFAARYGAGKLWLISERIHRTGPDSPWDSASRGGIVSTLQISSKTWSHKPYDRLDDDIAGAKLFSLNGRLFMLTYDTNGNKINYRKLFYWTDGANAKWTQLQFDVGASATTTASNRIQTLAVNVPKQSGKVAYVVASVHAQSGRGGEQAFAKLEAEFRGEVPTRASLKSLVHQQTRQPTAVFYTAVKGDKLYAFVQNFFSEGYVSEYQQAYTLDLKTNRLGNATLTGPAPGVSFDQSNMHQTENEVLIAGGTQVHGLGQLRSINDIFVLNLNTLQWQTTPYKVAQGGGQSTYDQDGKKLYFASLGAEGVRSAKVISS